MKIVYSDKKTGRSAQMQLDNEKAGFLMNHRINETIDGSALGLSGYKLKITGGSDKAGFPMRGDVLGSGKRYVLMTEGIGFRNSVEGEKRRKLVRGGTISEEIYQLNVAKWEEPKKAPAPAPAQAPAPAPTQAASKSK